MRKIDYSKMFCLRSDGRWQGHYKTPDGKRHTTCDKDPERLYKRICALSAVEATKPTFLEVAEAWEGRYRQTVTERSWANLRPHFEDLTAKWGKRPVEDIAAPDIIADLEWAKAKGYSRTVVNGRKVVITGILNQALADGYIKTNPAMSVRLPKGLKAGRRHYPGDDVVKAVFAHREDEFGFFPFLLLCTGMRKSEALALHVADIDWSRQEIRIDRSLTYHTHRPAEKLPKNGKPRTVPIIDALAGPLQKYISKTKDILFPQPDTYKTDGGGGYMTEGAYRTLWSRWCASAGLSDSGLTAHSLRHATATLLYDAGVDVYTAQKILGHAQVSTTMEIYTDLRDARAKASIGKFSAHISELASQNDVKTVS